MATPEQQKIETLKLEIIKGADKSFFEIAGHISSVIAQKTLRTMETTFDYVNKTVKIVAPKGVIQSIRELIAFGEFKNVAILDDVTI